MSLVANPWWLSWRIWLKQWGSASYEFVTGFYRNLVQRFLMYEMWLYTKWEAGDIGSNPTQ